MNGLLVVDKDSGITSHDVVARARRLLRTKKVGHAGTLDPMATGILVLGIGKATRLLRFAMASTKVYLATVRLGMSTVTDDAEGEALTQADATHVTAGILDEVIRSFRGTISQVPSAVSAVKVDGVRSYARVRAGDDVVLKARRVTVSRLDRISDLRRIDGYVDVDVEVECSSGTYVRALARDIGKELGVGGHLRALRRTRAGSFDLSQARTLGELEASTVDNRSSLLTHSLADAVRALFFTRVVEPNEAEQLRHGVAITPMGKEDVYAALDNGANPIALIQEKSVHTGETRACPIVGFSV